MQYSKAQQALSTLSALKVEQLMSINSMSKLDRKQNVLEELAASTNICTSHRVSVCYSVLGIHITPASNTFAVRCFRLKVHLVTSTFVICRLSTQRRTSGRRAIVVGAVIFIAAPKVQSPRWGWIFFVARSVKFTNYNSLIRFAL